MVMKLKFIKFGKITFEKLEKFYHDFSKTLGDRNFEKLEKFYCDFAKTVFFIILQAKELQHKILMSWSMKFKYVTT